VFVCDWLHFVWQNHFYVMLPFPRVCLDDPVMRPDAHQCLLYKLATCPDALQSSRRIQFSSASVRTPVSARQVKRFPSQTQIWEDNCNRPNAILDKTRRGEELQPSGRQGNTVLTPVLIMEIGCSWSASV
jgi:hypothetical protein